MRSDRGDVLLLQDILDAIEIVRQYLPPDRAAFDTDPKLQSHILRHVMIVGEAAHRLSKPLKDRNPHVPWRQIEGMRHVLVHDYFKVNWTRVYETARDEMTRLKAHVQTMLAAIPHDDDLS
ncbi:MAG TPA: HepT-like ribonuclease domain-containing protein [Tepidisphaeraceae bacterium]|jgi:uncharacterized protein with HEPN domain